ncbi:hypothetical protein [Nocardia sp. BMG111209]|uniref:hypothetical protein n=1 Tax=Nocardia sp. BMG111209 TaxID=1160137 RepID=UPI0003609494|nr:hypothetical protein [Nocardia sp. BMG111209]
MSGPKGIRYEIAREQRLAQSAARRWRALAGRARAQAARCAECGVEAVKVAATDAPDGDSAAITAECERLERAIDAAGHRLDAVLAERRSRRVAQELGPALAALAAREDTPIVSVAHPVAPRSTDVPARVRRMLQSLLEPSAELTGSASRILGCDPARAELLLADLDVRIRAANAHTTALLADRTALHELESELVELIDPAPVAALLRAAAGALDHNRSAAALLDTARRTLAERRDREQHLRDREFVRSAVHATFDALGYLVADVELATADDIVLRRNDSRTHAVRVTIAADEIGVRTVRTAAAPDAAADTAADTALCADLDELLAGLGARGVLPGRVRGAPPGLVAPRPVTVRAAKPAGRKRRSRESEERG